jgi:PAT family beta-lactamase induction signal transducer AmpG
VIEPSPQATAAAPPGRRRDPARDWLNALAVYRDRRVLAMLFLGFSSGLPFGALAEPFSAWLTDEGLGKTEIGLFALVSLPYSLKFVFAPFVDRLPLPLLGRRFGRRRSWALATQAALILVLVSLGATQPGTDPLATAILAVCVAFASATQDTVIDAYRVEMLEERSQAAGAATATFGWRLGQMAAGAGGLILADILPWSTVYALMAAAVLVGVVAVLFNPEPRTLHSPGAQMLEERAQAWLRSRQGSRLPGPVAAAAAWGWAACICPFLEFAQRRGWLIVLLFILLYKFGDAILGVMKVPFFLEMGFSKTDIAEIVKLFGFVATVVGSLFGGLVVAKRGIMRGLLVCGWAMALSNLVFVLQAWAGPDLGVLALTVSVENITTGMGMTAFVAYMSSLCNVAYTATQYALLTSLMAMGRTVLSSGAGWLAEQVPWTTFFILTTLAAAPGLLLLLLLMRRYQPAAD